MAAFAISPDLSSPEHTITVNPSSAPLPRTHFSNSLYSTSAISSALLDGSSAHCTPLASPLAFQATMDPLAYACTCHLRHQPYTPQPVQPSACLTPPQDSQGLGGANNSQSCSGEFHAVSTCHPGETTLSSVPTQPSQPFVPDASVPFFSCAPFQVSAQSAAATALPGPVQLFSSTGVPEPRGIMGPPLDNTFHSTQQIAMSCGGHSPFTSSFPSLSPFSSCSKDCSCISCSKSSSETQHFLDPVHLRQINIRPASQKRARDVEQSSSSSEKAQVKRVRAPDGSSKDVIAISRMPYVRPQQPKKFCPHCSEHPDGFRGEHELRRHVDRAHAREGRRKMWICVEKEPNGKTLSNCKKCRSNKLYGAYYNAAAHLRRAHFNPRLKGVRGKSSGSESRAGKGGGDEPPMHELKQFWIKEVDDPVSASSDADALDLSISSPSHAYPETPSDVSPTFLQGEFSDGCLSLSALSPLDVLSDNLAPSCASLSSSEDSQLDPLLPPLDCQAAFDLVEYGRCTFTAPLPVQ